VDSTVVANVPGRCWTVGAGLAFIASLVRSAKAPRHGESVRKADKVPSLCQGYGGQASTNIQVQCALCPKRLVVRRGGCHGAEGRGRRTRVTWE
jgi:hypothetical protein